MPEVKKLRIAFLLSGRGTTLANLLAKVDSGEVPAEVVRVISSRSEAGGLKIAAKAHIPSKVIRTKDFADCEAFSAAVTREMDDAGTDYAIFGGYLCYYIVPKAYRNRIINVHPALLPAFGGQGMWGEHVHTAVLESGVKVTGCTIHFVDDTYDHGPIILQKVVRVFPGDDVAKLAARVQRVERRALPEVLTWIAEERVRVQGRIVTVEPRMPKGIR